MKGNEKNFNHELTGTVNFLVSVGKKEFDVLKAFSRGFWDVAAVTVMDNQTLLISIDYTNALAAYKGEKVDLNDGGGGETDVH